MILPLLIGNILIWSRVRSNYLTDIQLVADSRNPLFDPDMDSLYDFEVKTKDDPLEEKEIAISFRQMVEPMPEPDNNDAIEPYIWVDGYKLKPGNKKDLKLFIQIKNQAYLKEQFQDIPLDDGGLEVLYLKWFQMLGASEYGAQKLVELGINPWEWNPEEL